MALKFNGFEPMKTNVSSDFANSFSKYGATNPRAGESIPRIPSIDTPSLPTTAGDFNQLTGISSGFMDQANTAMVSPSQLDIWEGRNGFGKTMFNKDGSFDLGAAGSILGGLGSLGQLYLGYQANETAKDTLKFKQQAYKENMANQISSFNMALEDKARSRAVQANQTPEEAQSYIDKHKL